MRSFLGLVCLALGLTAGGCKSTTSTSEVGAVDTAQPVGSAECATCNMVVREQPAPRAQLVHRDGTRAYFCSISDMLPYLAAPSSHGKAEHIFVEVMSKEEDPAKASTSEHPWAPAESAFYVVEVKRPGVMGAPVLSYPNAEVAQQAAQEHGGKVQSFDQLKQGAAK